MENPTMLTAVLNNSASAALIAANATAMTALCSSALALNIMAKSNAGRNALVSSSYLQDNKDIIYTQLQNTTYFNKVMNGLAKTTGLPASGRSAAWELNVIQPPIQGFGVLTQYYSNDQILVHHLQNNASTTIWSRSAGTGGIYTPSEHYICVGGIYIRGACYADVYIAI
jgi:hypothetical protein